MIKLTQIEKAFGEQIIFRGIDLEVRDGDNLFIVGGSGTGKSVLIKLILGLEKQDWGTVEIDGQNTLDFSRSEWQEVLSQFGVVFQGAALFDSLNVLENVGIKLYEAKSHHPKQIRSLVIEALEQVNLSESVLKKYPSELSGGMRKRVGIARAIIQNPRYLIYDEPTTGLDPASSDVIDELIGSLGSYRKRTSVVITHDMTSVHSLADRVIMINQGLIQFDGSQKEFFSSEDPIIDAFLARTRRHS
ncbi:MAG: ATP-binding cassette domain-containing protein [Bacteroidota bacterium]